MATRTRATSQRFVVLLRGIGPGDPRTRNAALIEVLQRLDLSVVRSVLSSGNIVVDSDERDRTIGKSLDQPVENPVHIGDGRLLGAVPATDPVPHARDRQAVRRSRTPQGRDERQHPQHRELVGVNRCVTLRATAVQDQRDGCRVRAGLVDVQEDARHAGQVRCTGGRVPLTR